MPTQEKASSPIFDFSNTDGWHKDKRPAMTSAKSPAQIRRRMLAGVAVFVIFFIWVTTSFRSSLRPSPAGPRYGGLQRVAKVSMLYGKPNAMYERALKSHARHSQKWGHPMHVLRQDISVGFWNKPSYLLSLVIQELAKHPEERVEWLMWVDADSIILNNNIPAEIFLPPSDLTDIHLVATKDQNGLNTGIMFLRVHPWTATMLTESLGYPLFRPEVDLGRSADQESMALVLKKDTGGPDGNGYKQGMVYIPRPLINTYEFHHGYEGNKGNLLVHFPGLEAERWSHMAKWLDIVEATPGAWERPLEETDYLAKTNTFWEQVRAATRAVADLEEKAKKMPSGTPAEVKALDARKNAVAGLKKALYENADDSDELSDLISNAKAFLE